MTTVNEAIETLTHAFGDFKTSQEARLHHLELAHKRPAFENNGGFLQAETAQKKALLNYVRQGEAKHLESMEIKNLTTGVEADGGYLIPQVIADRIGRDLEDLSPIRAISSVITISASAIELLLDKEGAEVGWVTEIAERPETKTPTLMKLRIPVHELYAKPRATQKLLDDARVDVESWLAGRIATKLSQVENHAFIQGDGDNKPKGFLTYETKDRATWEWGKLEHIKTGKDGAFSDQNAADILIETMNALKPEYQKGAVWLMSRSAHAMVRKLKDQNHHYLWQPGLADDVSPTLLGYPVVLAEDMPSLVAGTPSKSIVFGNFREGYQIVDRAGMRILRDPFSSKPYVEFYTTKRVGGDVINFEALKVIFFAA
mgnify:CR=1 FL=1